MRGGGRLRRRDRGHEEVNGPINHVVPSPPSNGVRQCSVPLKTMLLFEGAASTTKPMPSFKRAASETMPMPSFDDDEDNGVGGGSGSRRRRRSVGWDGAVMSPEE